MERFSRNIMNRLFSLPTTLAVLLSVVLLQARPVLAQSEGEKLFNSSTCIACHTIGKGRLVGPDLAGVHERRKTEWLKKFIKSSQSLIKAGDSDAVSIFNEYNQMIMPDQPLSDSQIEAIIQYIQMKSKTETIPTENITTELKVTPEDIARGQKYFQGIERFENKGPTCISCHHVKNDAVIGGGVLAKDLTTVFSRMSGSGVKAILGSPPFPVMEQAYKNYPLTEKEIHWLAVFLEDADKQHQFQKPRDYGMRLLTSGVVGTILLFGLFAFFMRSRKKKSVYASIFERQKQEEND